MSERVLLVDDEADFVEALAERMKNRGIDVETATAARDALDKVAAENFDAVVLDLMMPEMDGIEALKAMKEKNPDLQIILLTGHATVEKGIKAMKLGALDFLEKPIDMNTLAEKIKEAKAEKLVLLEKGTEDKIRKILVGKGW